MRQSLQQICDHVGRPDRLIYNLLKAPIAQQPIAVNVRQIV